MENLLPWQVIGMNLAALGTAISFAKFIFLPRQPLEKSEALSQTNYGFWIAVVALIIGLFAANLVYIDAYTLANIFKPLATIALGWLIYLLLLRRLSVKLPRFLEQFDQLVGMMSLMLVFLFWAVFAT